MKRILTVLLLFVGIFTLAGCPAKDVTAKATVERADSIVVITVEEAEGTPTLLDVMKILQEEGKLNFTADPTGMIVSIDGKANAADWSKYWALYISDAELSDMSYGIEWNGQQLGFSNFGAEALSVEAGGVYVWQYFDA